jgi:hypothetical protein
MSDKELVTIDAHQMGGLIDQLAQINTNLGAIRNAIENSVNNNTTEVTKWLGQVAAEIAKLQQPLPPPQPKMRGTIMADYSIPDDTPDGRVTFHLNATDSEGVAITDPAELAKLGFTVTGSNDAAFVVTLDTDQPDPANRVGGYHVGAPGQAAVTENLTAADGTLIGTGTDGFTVTTGKVALGSVDAKFDGLTPIAP